MPEHLDRLQDLMSLPRIDTGAVSASLDALPLAAGAEIAVVIAQARRAVAQVSSGKDWYKPLLRHAIGRLVVLLKERVTEPQASRSGMPTPLQPPPTLTGVHGLADIVAGR